MHTLPDDFERRVAIYNTMMERRDGQAVCAGLPFPQRAVGLMRMSDAGGNFLAGGPIAELRRAARAYRAVIVAHINALPNA